MMIILVVVVLMMLIVFQLLPPPMPKLKRTELRAIYARAYDDRA